MSSSSAPGSEFDVLERALMRLGGTEDADLERVLQTALPRLMVFLGRPDARTRDQAIRVMKYIQERVRDTSSVRLPVDQLIQLYRSPAGQNAVIGAFTLMFIEQGIRREPAAERQALLNSLLIGASQRPTTHRQSLISAIICTLPHIVWAYDAAHNRELMSFTGEAKDRQWILGVFEDLLLLHPVGTSSQAEEPGFGQSSESWSALAKVDKSIEALKMTKLAILKFLNSGIFTPDEVFVLGLIAISDSNHEVVDRAEVLFRQLGKGDVNSPAVAQHMASLYSGSNQRKCASLPLKLQLVLSLSKSQYAAAELFGPLLKVIFDAAFGAHSVVRLIRYGMDLLAFTIKTTSPKHIEPVGTLILGLLLKLFQRVNDPQVLSNTDSCLIRSQVYDCLASLIGVVPKLAVNSTQIPSFLFSQLSSEIPHVKPDLNGALSRIAKTYGRWAPGSIRNELKSQFVKLTSSDHSEANAPLRVAALTWLSDLYAFRDCEARVAALLMVADPSAQVRETAKASLLPRRESISFSTIADESTSPASGVLSPYPDFVTMIEYLDSLAEAASETPLILQHTLVFLRLCIASTAQQGGVSIGSFLNSVCSVSQQAVMSYYSKIRRAFASYPLPAEGLSALQREASISLLQLTSLSVEPVFQELCTEKNMEWLFLSVCGSEDIDTRLHLSEVLGLVSRRDSVPSSHITDYINRLAEQTRRPPTRKGNGFVHGSIVALGNLIASCLDSRKLPPESLEEPVSIITSNISNSIPLFSSGACFSVSLIARSGRLPVHNIGPVVESLKLVARSCQAEYRASENAVLALGSLAIFAETDSGAVASIVDSIIALSNVRDENILFAAGESLVICCGAGRQHSAFRVSILQSLIGRLMDDMIQNGSVVSRCAGAVWLLCVVTEINKNGDFLHESSQRIQEAFASLLMETRALTQECACKGLAILYDTSPIHIKDELLLALKRIIPTASKVDPESSVKEMLAIASELGRSELVYRFLDVSCQHPIWASQQFSKFSIGSLHQTGATLKLSLSSILPKLYRYQFDPLKRVQTTMKALWTILVPEPSATVTANFDAIISDMVASLVSGEARVRQASCLALLELIAGRSFKVMQPHLGQLFTNAFLVIDDVNDAVRSCALSLSVALCSFAERVCDVTILSNHAPAAALDIILPVLLNHGLQARSKEVNAVAISTLVRVINVSGGLITPHSPIIVPILLEALSTSENQILNYAMFHTGSLNVTQEQLEGVRLAMAKASPISTALSAVASHIDESVAGKVISSVVDIIRQGTGLPTLDGAAQLIISLVQRLGPHLAQHAQVLTSSLLEGLEGAGPSVRASYVACLARVATVAGSSELQHIIDRAIQFYFDRDQMELGGAIARELTRTVKAEALRPFGNALMPTCFIAMHHNDNGISTPWMQAWEDGTLGTTTGAKMYLDGIIETIKRSLQSAAYDHKRAALISICKLAAVVKDTDMSQCLAALFYPVMECISCPYWAGKESALLALAAISGTCPDYFRASPNVLEAVTTALQREAGRIEPVEFRIGVFDLIANMSQLFPSVDWLSSVSTLLRELIEGGDAAQGDSSRSDAKLMNDLTNSALRCVAHTWSQQSVLTFDAAVKLVSQCCRGHDPKVRSCAMRCLQVLLSRAGNDEHALAAVDPTLLDGIISSAMAALNEGKLESIRTAALDLLLAVLQRSEQPKARLDDVHDLMFRLASDTNPDVIDKCSDIKRLIQRRKAAGATRA
ncbi:unnamed protein product (mitochondrion) [Plasmodiophora brassicae]|uniref:TOG domain-containing protein n=1 Tax=Plasmodiophora brassicae TaxID=37360 RepID=A0A3P3YLN6_PLABS|nr:unnamed protein product [Plasmodiophora brassicae]